MSKSIVAVLVLLSLLLEACGARIPASSSPPRASLSNDACEQPWSSPLIPKDDASSGDKPLLAGGTVRSGDFVVAIWLYCDPSLSDDSPDEPNYSEIKYLGIRSEWQYMGLPIGHGDTTVLSVNGEQISQSGGGPTIGFGDGEVGVDTLRTPNLTAAQAVAKGEPLEFLISIYVPDPAAAAKLTVTFDQTKDGYVLAKAEIEPVQAAPR